MTLPSRTASPWLAAGLSLAGMCLLFTPVDVAAKWRAKVRDAFYPGQRAVRIAWDSAADAMVAWRVTNANGPELQALRDQLRSAERQLRQHALEKARLHVELDQAMKNNPLAPTVSQALFRPKLIEARILGEEATTLWRNRKLLDVGTAAGSMESALVLEAGKPLIDLGLDAELAAEQPVYAGQVVVGKIDLVGRWSSTLLRVTDAGYTGRARIGRRTSEGMYLGSEATLKGDGSELCRLEPVPLSEPVGVGDEVYTGGTDGALPYPMFYGTVVKAEPQAGKDHWLIQVKPAAPKTMERVQILRTVVNETRLLAN